MYSFDPQTGCFLQSPQKLPESKKVTEPSGSVRPRSSGEQRPANSENTIYPD